MPPQTFTLNADEAKLVTPFYQWADAYMAGMAAGMNAAKRKILDDVMAARSSAPPVEPPKQEEPKDAGTV